MHVAVFCVNVQGSLSDLRTEVATAQQLSSTAGAVSGMPANHTSHASSRTQDSHSGPRHASTVHARHASAPRSGRTPPGSNTGPSKPAPAALRAARDAYVALEPSLASQGPPTGAASSQVPGPRVSQELFPGHGLARLTRDTYISAVPAGLSAAAGLGSGASGLGSLPGSNRVTRDSDIVGAAGLGAASSAASQLAAPDRRARRASAAQAAQPYAGLAGHAPQAGPTAPYPSTQQSNLTGAAAPYPYAQQSNLTGTAAMYPYAQQYSSAGAAADGQGSAYRVEGLAGGSLVAFSVPTQLPTALDAGCALAPSPGTAEEHSPGSSQGLQPDAGASAGDKHGHLQPLHCTGCIARCWRYPRKTLHYW